MIFVFVTNKVNKAQETTCILLSHIHMFNAIKTRVWGELQKLKALNGADTNFSPPSPKVI